MEALGGEKMFLKHLTWIFIGLFVLFGAPMMMTESAFWGRVWAGLSTLSLGGFAFSMVRDALSTGQIRVQCSVIRYSDQTRLFWAAIIVIAAAGIVVLIAGFWVLFFKN
jgi:hypothetical protein